MYTSWSCPLGVVATWTCCVYEELPAKILAGEITSGYVSNATETGQSVPHNRGVFAFRGTNVWLDIDLPNLAPADGLLDRMKPRALDVERCLPPQVIKNVAGRHGGGGLGLYARRCCGIAVHAGVVIIDDVGLTINIPITEAVVLRRNLYIRGKLASDEKPQYLEEFAAPGFPRAPHDCAGVVDNKEPEVRKIALFLEECEVGSRCG